MHVTDCKAYNSNLKPCLFSETYCKSLSQLDGVTVSSDNTSYGSEVNISCDDPNLHFLDGKTHKSVKCQRTGKWNELVSNCSGSYKRNTL